MFYVVIGTKLLMCRYKCSFKYLVKILKTLSIFWKLYLNMNIFICRSPKLDYSSMSHHFQQHDDRQQELQKYIKMVSNTHVSVSVRV